MLRDDGAPAPAPAIDPKAARPVRLVLRPLSALALLLENISMAIAGLCFVLIVLITAVDVVMRYVFNAPLVWAFVLISDYLMVAVFFLAVGATQRHNQNIGVDFVTRRLPHRVRAALAAVCLLLMLGYIFLLGNAGWYAFTDAWDSNDVLAGVIAWPRWPALILVPIGCGLLALRVLIDLLGSLGAVAGAPDLAQHQRASGFSDSLATGSLSEDL
jgi:TRAP-type C4-dicarboxylate transport system permease small subunit